MPADVGEMILAKVPLLRLAQLAHLSKEFQEAYEQRMAAHVATTARLEGVCIGPGPDCVFRPFRDELRIRKCPSATWRPRDPDNPFDDWSWHGWDTTELPTCLIRQHRNTCATLDTKSLGAALRVFGSFDVVAVDLVPGSTLNLHADVKIEVVEGLARTAICKELLLSCFGLRAYTGQDLAGWLMLCIAMAGPLRGFLDDVARGPPCDGVARGAPCDRERSGEACVVPSVTLVLPHESGWPNEADEAAIWEALTCVLAIVGGRPSGARLALEHHITSGITNRCLSKFKSTKRLAPAVLDNEQALVRGWICGHKSEGRRMQA